MFKSLGNLLLIFMICLVAMGVSIRWSPIDENILSTSSQIKEQDVYLAIDATEQPLSNPSTVTIKHHSKNHSTLSITTPYLFEAEIYRGQKLYDTYIWAPMEKETPFDIQLTQTNPYYTSLDISQENLNLPNGTYEIILTSKAQTQGSTIDPIKLTIDYFTEIPYIAATNVLPKDTMPLTLYFPDKDYKIESLIGVTRFVNPSSRPLTETLEELKKGPLGKHGLSAFATVGDYHYVTQKKGITYVDLPSKEAIYTENPAQGKVAMLSMIKSLGAFDGVDRLRFLVDYDRADTFFGDQDISESITYSLKNRAYVAYYTPQRYYLIDTPISDGINDKIMEEKISKVFSQLKQPSSPYLTATVPDSVELLNYTVRNHVLTLSLSKDFLTSLEGHKDLQRMMVDAMLFSFTSLDGVQNVKFLVEDKEIDEFAGLPMSTPMTCPKYINPE